MAELEKGTAGVTDQEALKEKYGKLYKISSEITEDEDTENPVILEYLFVKPNVASINRYLKTGSKNMISSTTAFVLDNVVSEQKDHLAKMIAEYPTLPIAIGQKLLAVTGLSDNVNLMKL